MSGSALSQLIPGRLSAGGPVLLSFLLLAACAGKPADSDVAANGGATATNAAAKAPPKYVPPKVEDGLHPRGADFSTAPEKIAFSSGIDQNQPQPLWKAIAATEPDLFLAMGNIVDATGGDIPGQYKKLSDRPEYRNARESIAFMAIWNDKDLGTEDGGADAPTLSMGRKEFLNHFRYVNDSLLPLGRDGLYHSKMIGGQVTGKRRKRVQGPTLQVIMLDTRTFRSPLKRSPEVPSKIVPNEDKGAALLGETQWNWLEDQLRRPANFRLVVSPIPLIDGGADEKWADFPAERERFFNLLRRTGAKNVVVLTGGTYPDAIAKTDVKGWGQLIDVTAGPLSKAPAKIDAQAVSPDTPVKTEKETFGLATFDWHRKSVKLEVKDLEGKTLQATDLRFH